MKKALLIGINKYTGIDNLKGCVNDLYSMKSFLEKNDFDSNNITFLINEEATYKNIQKAYDNFFTNSVNDKDILFYYHSGHGHLMYDENSDERNYFDEALICHDSQMNTDQVSVKKDGLWSKIILDDYIKQKILNLNHDTCLEMIFDTCHSGSIVDWEGGDLLKDGEPMKNIAFWSSSREDETSSEDIHEIKRCDSDSSSLYRGAFTLRLEKILYEDISLSRKDVYSAILTSLSTDDFKQKPQFFFTGNIQNKSFLRF